MSIFTSTLELAGVSSSSTTVPDGCGNRPRTLLCTCFDTNATDEFSGSKSHVAIFGTAGMGIETDGSSDPRFVESPRSSSFLHADAIVMTPAMQTEIVR
jgi:hypothetical protein